jgi:type IV secretory pathway VirB10-like protein
MANYGLDPDEITRWVLLKEYRLRRPTPEQISQYRYWHHVSRTRGFDVAGPWERWPWKPIPPDAVADVPAPAAPPAPMTPAPEPELPQIGSVWINLDHPTAEPSQPEPSGIDQTDMAQSGPTRTSSPASVSASDGQPRAKERAGATRQRAALR